MQAARDYVGLFTDSRRWAKFSPRPDDIYVCTPPKCGTTWMQTILALLLSGDAEVEPRNSSKSPWLDMRYRDIDQMIDGLEAQTERRCIKSHTPFDGLPQFTDGTYLAVYRHPLDAHFSMRRHVANVKFDDFDAYFPADDDARTFEIFLTAGTEGMDYDANPLAALVHHYQTFRSTEAANVHLFHYSDMCRDLTAEMTRVAKLLGLEFSPAELSALAKVASFDSMSADAARFAPGGGGGFWKSDAAFFDSGTSGKWHGKLSDDQLAAYDAAIAALLPPEARLWLENGTQS